MTTNAYEYPDQLEASTLRGDDQSFDNDMDREDDQTTSAEYELLLQEAIDTDLKETELTGQADAIILLMQFSIQSFSCFRYLDSCCLKSNFGS
jgi:hypothetical protein